MPREKVELLKRTVCKEADDNQLALFLHVCEAHRLDPFRKQIYAIFFNNDESRAGRGPKDMVIITGIDGFRVSAARDHKDFGGTSSAKFTWFDQPVTTPAGRKVPESATVTVYRKGGDPVDVTVYWEEYAPRDLTETKSAFWNRMPKNQLEKCAEAKGLRKEFPGLGDIFLIQEVAQRIEGQTEGGRDITDAQGYNADGQPVTHAARFEQGRRNAQDVAKQKLEQHAQSEHPTIREAAKRGLEEMEKKHKPAAQAKEPEFRFVELDLSNPEDPIIRGDLAEILAALQEYCQMEWKGDWWHIQPKDVDTVIAFLDHCNERIRQGDGRLFKVRKVVPQGDQKKSTQAAPKQKRGSTPPEEPTLVAGVVIRCDAAMVREGKTPVRQVKINNSFHACYRNTLFPFLDKSIGKNVEVWTDKRHQIVGLKKIASQDFDKDGATPITRTDREPGNTRSLWDK